MQLSGRARFYFVVSAVLFLFGAACDTAYAFPKSALLPGDRSVPELIIMATSAFLGVMGGLWVFLRTRSKRPRRP